LCGSLRTAYNLTTPSAKPDISPLPNHAKSRQVRGEKYQMQHQDFQDYGMSRINAKIV
jgi:hypothetical protein